LGFQVTSTPLNTLVPQSSSMFLCGLFDWLHTEPNPTPFLCQKSLGGIPDDVLVIVLSFVHFRELKEIIKVRPWLSDKLSLEDIALSFYKNEMWRVRLMYPNVWCRNHHMISTLRFCRILDPDFHRICEICKMGDEEASYTEWWGLWMCRDCEYQTQCKHPTGCGCRNPDGPQYFCRWIVTQPGPNFKRKVLTLKQTHEDRGDGPGVNRMCRELNRLRISNYCWGINGWAGVLSKPLYDSISGDPIGPVVTDELVTQTLDRGMCEAEFLKSLPTGPDLSRLVKIIEERRL